LAPKRLRLYESFGMATNEGEGGGVIVHGPEAVTSTPWIAPWRTTPRHGHHATLFSFLFYIKPICGNNITIMQHVCTCMKWLINHQWTSRVTNQFHVHMGIHVF
jgi:hypothetical protein